MKPRALRVSSDANDGCTRESLALLDVLEGPRGLIGYDKASPIARKASDEGTTLREAPLASGVDADEFDRVVDPNTMVGDSRHDLASAVVS